MRAAVLLVRFLSELAVLAALAVIGLAVADGAVGILLAVALPSAAAATWGRYVAPASTRRLHDPARAAVEVAIFGGSVAGLGLTRHPMFAVALGVAALVTAPLARRYEPTAASVRR